MGKSWWIVGLGLLLVACSNQGAQTPSTSLAGVVRKSGDIVTLGGRVLDLSQASITEDGQGIPASRVRDGSEIVAQGSEQGGRIAVRSLELRYRAKGVADEVNTSESFVTVVGLKALVTAETRIVQENPDGSETPLTLADLQAGDFLKVAGLAQADDSIVASRIEREAEDDPNRVELRVRVRELDTAAQTFTYGLRTYVVDYSGAELKGTLSEGVFVRVKGTKSGNTVLASKVRAEDEKPGGTRIELEGIVSDLDTVAQTFKIESLTVDYSQAEVRGNLVNGARVHVRGTLEGSLVRASRVKVQQEEGKGEAELEGLISDFDPASRTFVVGGITVHVNDLTRYEDDSGDDIRSSGGEGDEDQISAEEFWGTNRDGQQVEVEGLATGSSSLLAREIELE
ncbi:DUF5666 domain-containing protein [Calidithermus roseus]|uniref:DUF5666 domain-containing protein n=1 Tax=Calidithermus roseus TaxID=1644118 RepID=A0A399EL26_9DEIN|nr:DUF5666 domain-containing protein [Calidithermus roseus]RIH84163.1 hypothetical protein Mrose_02750 [Calidithermus roseus]